MLKRLRFLPHILNHQKGQSFVEFALLIVAIMVVVIAFVGKGQLFHTSVEDAINSVPDAINRLQKEIVYGNGIPQSAY